jgi:hypothetical protein
LKLAYVLVLGVIVIAFVLQYEWLLYVSLALLLIVVLLNYKAAASRPLPAGMAKPFQAAPPGAHGQAQALPKRKKKIRRPIIIIQPPPHAESLTRGILDESIKHSFPHFMTPQEKLKHAKEEAEREELMHLLKEQRKELKELREELEDPAAYRRKKIWGDED